MKMYCMRFENSHMLRSFVSIDSSRGGSTGSDASISVRPRFREGIVTGYSEKRAALECSLVNEVDAKRR